MQVIIFIRKDLVTVMNDFSKLISDFFIRYLSNQKNASENTIKTYRDAFVLLLEFMKIKNIESNKLKISDFNYDLINEYLDWLESDKKVSVSTRNNRLAAIKSFFRYVSYHRPEYMTICTSILEIHKKKSKSKPMNYLTIDEGLYNLRSLTLTFVSSLTRAPLSYNKSIMERSLKSLLLFWSKEAIINVNAGKTLTFHNDKGT